MRAETVIRLRGDVNQCVSPDRIRPHSPVNPLWKEAVPLWQNTARATVPLISLCMIVKDEEPWIARCLSSVRAGVDEIIIVDTGSRDRTMDIARGFGATILQFPWKESFGKPAIIASFMQEGNGYYGWMPTKSSL